MKKPSIHVIGMHGMGDCIHQRAILKHLIKDHTVYLETSWPQIYWDIPELILLARGTRLRTQLKNQQAMQESFVSKLPETFDKKLRIAYSPASVQRYKSVFLSMLYETGLNITEGFNFEPRSEWVDLSMMLIPETKKPILIYRPLVERREWGGCANRNPDAQTYYRLLQSFKDHFTIISIADLQEGEEWMVSEPIVADYTFHKGELSFELIAALFQRAVLVYCAPGFSSVLSRAMGKPVITVFGGYENSKSFMMGYGPYLGIDTISPCECFSHKHNCEKTIDVETAKHEIREFIDVNVTLNKN